MFSLTFEEDGDRFIQLRATNKGGEIKGEGNTLYGYDVYVNEHTKHYFYAEFDQTPVAFSEKGNGTSLNYAQFDKNVKKVNMRYGVSYISVEQAKKNLEKEIKDFDLEALASTARNEWNKVLSKIDVKGGSEDQKTTFYTALYRSHERMINISEDGKYFSGFDGKVHDDEGVDFWTDDWIWDNYHALHPLQIILNPAAEEEKLASYIRMYEHSGWVPTFPCVFGDAHCMNGNHAAAMFNDALAKGLKFDVNKAYEGMRHTVLNETMIPWSRGPKTVLDDFYHEKHGEIFGLMQKYNLQSKNIDVITLINSLVSQQIYEDEAAARSYIKLLVDVVVEKAVVVPNGATLDLNGNTIQATAVVGKLAMNGGALKTYDTNTQTYFFMAAPAGTAALYWTSDAVMTIGADYALSLDGGSVTLPNSWRSLLKQTLTIKSGASFEIPQGVELNLRGNAVVEEGATLTCEGTIALGNTYDAVDTSATLAGVELGAGKDNFEWKKYKS